MVPPDPALALPDISLPGAGLPGVGLPSTTQMLDGLRERRDILREQLQMAGNRRSSLVGQLNQEGDNSLPREAREGIQRRIDLIDERILQLERDQALTEQLISNAPPEVLAASEAESRFQNQAYNGGNIDEGEAAGIGFATFGVGIILTLLVSRFRRGWRAKRGGAMAAAAQVREDPRIDRLTQTVEAIAEEVERIGEGQRFVTQLLANRPGAGALQAEALAAEGQHR
ncbi:MAG: hypothetical protein V4617_10880 [Gemmatimonadota bacterium]